MNLLGVLCTISGMLYRHFPKIANRTASILSIDLSMGAEEAELSNIAQFCATWGLSLVATGSSADLALRARKKLSSSKAQTALLLEFPGSTPEELKGFISATKPQAQDILLVRITDAQVFDSLQSQRTLTLLEDMQRQGLVGEVGFYIPEELTGDTALLTQILDGSPIWSCWSTPFNYLSKSMTEAFILTEAAAIPLIARDPFAGGVLANPPAEIHQLFYEAPVPRRRDEWALRAIWERQEVLTIAIAPMDEMSMTRSAILAEAGRPNSLPSSELSVISRAATLLRERKT